MSVWQVQTRLCETMQYTIKNNNQIYNKIFLDKLMNKHVDLCMVHEEWAHIQFTIFILAHK